MMVALGDCEMKMIIPVYNNLGPIFINQAIMYISYIMMSSMY